MQRLLASRAIQAQLTVSHPDDEYEREADRVADRVMRMSVPEQPAAGPIRSRADVVQRACPQCEREARDDREEELVQAQAAGPGAASTFSRTEAFASNLAGRGEPLPEAVRTFMEPRFGADFGAVRVHTGAEADRSAEEISALAYTRGDHIVFRAGHYQPATRAGQRLLAHELTHVLQQNGGGGTPVRRAPRTIQRLGDVSKRPVALDARCPLPPGSPHPIAEVVEFGDRVTTLTTLDGVQIDNFVRNWHATGTSQTVRVDGFASRPGGDALNWELSCARAEAVVADLLSPQGGGPGIPRSNILVFAHGETDEFGAEARNRRVSLSLSGGKKPVPTPIPPVPPPPAPPKFLCGPDVTKQLTDACSLTKTTFAGWSGTQKASACHALTSLVTGGYAWDIVDLHNNAWILAYRPACATAGATPPCGSSIQVNKDCHYAGSANYVIYGIMCKLCSDHFTSIGSKDAADFTEAEMLSWINKYKGTGFTGLSTPSANFVESQKWASAGYHDWPTATEPAGDRSGCSPTCPTPYGGAAFRVNWVPIGVF